MTSTSTTTTDRLYNTYMKLLGDSDVLKLRPDQYATIVEVAIALASQPNRIYQ